jgi:molybdenum cofactor cytidylyltransferase
VPPAARAHPELIRRPRHARRRIAHFHLGTAALTPDVQVDVGHARDSSRRSLVTPTCPRAPQWLYDAGVIPAVVLAAGKSSRMGRPKALLPLEGGETFLSRVVRTFLEADVDDVVIVVGHDADAIVGAFAASGLAARFVVNRDYERGQLSSLVAGLGVVDRPGVAACLLTLVDVPLVAPSTIRAVIDRYRTTRAPIVRPVRGSDHGHPVLVDRSLFDSIRHADPAAGAKAIVRANASPAGDVEIQDDGAFADIDTPEDYRRIAIWR